jgi:hypothetical protein
MRRHRRHASKRPASAAVTQAQREAMIPCGPVNTHRALRNEIEVENREFSLKGTPLTTGQVVSTPVRKLFQQGVITEAQLAAAQLFQTDYERAYLSCQNPLAAVQVDARGGGTGALDNRLHHAIRFRNARAHLRPRLARIADYAILNETGGGVEPTFTTIGAFFCACAPSKRSQQDKGRDALTRVCKRLASFYEKAHRSEHNGVRDGK